MRLASRRSEPVSLAPVRSASFSLAKRGNFSRSTVTYGSGERSHPMTVITWWMPVGVSEPLNKGRRPAVLKAIIREAVQHGCCTMSTLDLADVAMCNSSTVRSVIKFAIEAGLIIVKDGTIMLDPRG